MTDLEISKALALAIGHAESDVFVYADTVEVADHEAVEDREFDYRDWNVIGPIAERYDASPSRSVSRDVWYASYEGNGLYMVREDTPQKAIALAVIQGAKK